MLCDLLLSWQHELHIKTEPRDTIAEVAFSSLMSKWFQPTASLASKEALVPDTQMSAGNCAPICITFSSICCIGDGKVFPLQQIAGTDQCVRALWLTGSCQDESTSGQSRKARRKALFLSMASSQHKTRQTAFLLLLSVGQLSSDCFIILWLVALMCSQRKESNDEQLSPATHNPMKPQGKQQSSLFSFQKHYLD